MAMNDLLKALMLYEAKKCMLNKQKVCVKSDNVINASLMVQFSLCFSQ